MATHEPADFLLCCVVLCCVVLCCVVLCCVVLCCFVLCCVVLCYVVLCCIYKIDDEIYLKFVVLRLVGVLFSGKNDEYNTALAQKRRPQHLFLHNDSK